MTFIGTAIWKFATLIAELAAKMPWMGPVWPIFLYSTALLDLLAGLGVVLPSLLHTKPELTTLGAIGCVALVISAIAFHVLRGETEATPTNFVFIALALFVA